MDEITETIFQLSVKQGDLVREQVTIELWDRLLGSLYIEVKNRVYWSVLEHRSF